MNSFLELHSDSDYRNTNREYYTYTWESIAAASDYLIPFQFPRYNFSDYIYGGDNLILRTVDPDGNKTTITNNFFGSQKITGWTASGGSITATGPAISSGSVNAGGYIYSNSMSFTANEAIYLDLDGSAFNTPADWQLNLCRGATVLVDVALDEFDGSWGGKLRCFAATTASDYNIKIYNQRGAGALAITSNTPYCAESYLIPYYDLWWYNGDQLNAAISDSIYYLEAVDSDTYYSDWIDACGFTGKTKIKVSSSVDYGGVKYTLGYSQWTYKDASVRRSPRSDIEITSEQRNGVRVDEKRVAAVRYVMRVKVTESEYEGFVHAAAGNLEITDPQGKVYDCTGVEINDPSWYRGNGILEITFNDANNISVYSLNNSTL